MQITARVDYAIRSLAHLATLDGSSATRGRLAAAQGIPPKFLEAILTDLVKAGVLTSARGAAGGFALARAASEITLADIARAVDGPLAAVRGVAPEDAAYRDAALPLRDVWVALRASMRRVLEATTLAHLASGDLPPDVRTLLADPAAWERR